MKSKILSIFLLFILGPTLFTCGTCDPVPSHFEIKGIESYNMRFTNAGLNPWEVLDKNEQVNWTNFFVRFGFKVNYIAASKPNLGGTLLALSCPEAGEAGDKIGVDTLIVRTVFDYNENYLAGSVINEIILTNTWTYSANNFEEFLPLATYLAENSEGVRQQTLELKLTKEPTTAREFAFDVTFKLNNGEEFQHRTEPINLTN